MRSVIFMLAILLIPALSNAQTKKTDVMSTIQTNRVYFIDKFLIPAAAKKEFYERMSINRNFIKTLPGFITDDAYEYTDEKGNLICVTVAQWENKEAFGKAREAVQEEYKKEGFDPAAMFKRLNITADRGVYTKVQE